ncbi:MAG: hypothetical protein GX444_15520 [Myxococcales bacterium]|nr:hypothetical protein [Myxococcales bacterium]
MRTHLATVVVSSILLFLSTSAEAFTRNFDICFKYDVEFSNAAQGDYYENNAVDQKAYGIHAIFTDITDSGNPITVKSDYTDFDGCVNLNLDTAKTYRIKLTAKAQLHNSNYIYAKSAYEGGVQHTQIVATAFHPPISGDAGPFVYSYNSTWKVSNVMAAAGFSVDRRPAGVSGHSVYYYTEPCDPLEPDSACHRSEQGCFLGAGCRDNKFCVSHETGHDLLDERKFNVDHHNTYLLNDPDCPCVNNGNICDHRYHSLEWKSAAVWEGFADFYGSAAWNDAAYPDDCEYGSNDCGTSGSYITTVPCCVDSDCDGKGVEGDVTNFLWDLYTAVELTLSEIADIYVWSDTPNWVQETIYEDLMESAVETLSYLGQNDWDGYASDNGVDYGEE